MITININKAKEIQKDKLRAERASILAQLDVEFMRAMEAGDSAKMQEIGAKKQALRDAPQHESLVNAQSIEELKQVTISSILGEE
jgi:hypothetical protein